MSVEWVIAVALLVVFGLGYARLRNRAAAADESGVPPQLRGAEVAYAETTFRSRHRRLVTRLDRAYRTPLGLVLVEFKTRARNTVYQADIIELSVQRLAIADQTGEHVVPEGWVIVQQNNGGRRQAHRVRLMEGDQIEALSERFRAVEAGRVKQPAPAKSTRQCLKCGHFESCSRKFGDRGVV